MKFIALLIFTLFSHYAQADLVQRARDIARDIGEQSSRLSAEQARSIDAHLLSIRQILEGSGDSDTRADFTCVSRDNDGRAPWQIGRRDFANVIKVPGTAFKDLEECKKSIALAKRVRSTSFVCATRDNDGSGPYLLGVITADNQWKKIENGMTRSLEDCHRELTEALVLKEGILFCGSRDRDGSGPYVSVGVRSNGDVTVGQDAFRTYEECKAGVL